MENFPTRADIEAHKQAQLDRRANIAAEQRIARALATHADLSAASAAPDTNSTSGPYASQRRRFMLTDPAYHHLIRLAARANYVASSDTQRAKGLGDFIRDLFDPNPAAGGPITFADCRPEHLKDPDSGYTPRYAHPDVNDYPMWLDARADRPSDTTHWRNPRLIKCTDATFANIINVALTHMIANPDRLHRTWADVTAILKANAANPNAARPIHTHDSAPSQAAMVLEAIGLDYLRPSHLPHSYKKRRSHAPSRLGLTDLQFF